MWQAATAEVLAELEVHNISTAPKFPVTLQRLLIAADDEEDCQALFEEMQDAVGAPQLYPIAQQAPAMLNKVPGQLCIPQRR